MAGALCIDFGTSSIRAVRRKPKGQVDVLPLGAQVRSRLDDASIRSDIFVDTAAQEVWFSEAAVRARAAAKGGVVYDSSPKLWLTNPEELLAPVASGVDLTRSELLAGLLAYAMRAALEAGKFSADSARKLQLRLARPVWEPSIAARADLALDRIGAAAWNLASEIPSSGHLPASKLKKMVQGVARAGAATYQVVEPVAAAVELMPSELNVTRICAVIDVGAGTTDIGLFQIIQPDETRKMPDAPWRLYPIAGQHLQGGQLGRFHRVGVVGVSCRRQRRGLGRRETANPGN